MIEVYYNNSRTQATFQKETIENELMHMWNWEKEPITVTKKTLTVGDKATFNKYIPRYMSVRFLLKKTHSIFHELEK